MPRWAVVAVAVLCVWVAGTIFTTIALFSSDWQPE